MAEVRARRRWRWFLTRPVNVVALSVLLGFFVDAKLPDAALPHPRPARRGSAGALT